MVLAANIAEIFGAWLSIRGQLLTFDAKRVNRARTVDEINNLGECSHRIDGYALNHRRFARISGRHEQVRNFLISREHRDREDSFHRPQLSVEGKFSRDQKVRQILFREQAVTAKNTDGHRKVERRALFLHVGRREVHSNSLVWGTKSIVTDGRDDAAAGFTNGGIRQSDDIELAVSSSRNIGFDIDEIRFDAVDGR